MSTPFLFSGRKRSRMKTIIICIVIVFLISLICVALCKCAAEADRQFDVAFDEWRKKHAEDNEEEIL